MSATQGLTRAAPAGSLEAVRLLIALSAGKNSELKVVDVKTAYLQARMTEDDKAVYLILPIG